MIYVSELYILEQSLKLSLVDVEKYGFKIDKKFIKKYSNNTKILLNKKPTEALVRARKDLPKGYNFSITYGFRSFEEQENIVKKTEEELKKSHPHEWEELLDRYTGGYKDLKQKKISFMNHRSGNAVDLKLLLNNKEVDLGDVKLNKQDELTFFEKKKSLSKKEETIRDNRRLFKEVLEKHGFKYYPKEWWHWGYTK